MVRFAHLADVHLGAFRDARLRELNLQAFEQALDEAARRNVDFLIIAGDLFDISVPDLSVVERAVRKMRRFGKPIYAVYGSHDYSPTQTSVIDVLSEAGVLTKVSCGAYADGEENAPKKQKLHLDVLTDPKTGVSVTGLSARKLGLEKTYFEDLDTRALEKISGNKIFVFHCAIQEHKPQILQRVDAVPLSHFPKGFDYYAGGHVHARLLTPFGTGQIAYPGPLFAADFRDLDELAHQDHGFFVVDLDGRNGPAVDFVPVRVASVKTVRVDAQGLRAPVAQEKLASACRNAPAADVVLLHVLGTLAQGKPSDLDWPAARKALEQKSPIVYVNNALDTAEKQTVRVSAEKPELLCEKIFRENLAGQSFLPGLSKEPGVKTSLALLDELRMENPGDHKKRWEDVVCAKGEQVLGVEA